MTPMPSASPAARALLLASSVLLSLGLAGCDRIESLFANKEVVQLPGYIEADLTSIASPVAGSIAAMDVKEGQLVAAGDKLYLLESQRERAQLAEAEARKAQANSQARNISTGATQAELDTIRAKLRSAKAQWAQAQTQLEKTEALVKKGFVTDSQLDVDRTNVQLAYEQVQEARASLRFAKQGGRSEEQEAAQAQTEAAQAGVEQVRWLLQQKQISAPIAGVVQEIFIRQGEFAQSGMTVLSLLRQDSLRVRFFVPTALRPAFLTGGKFQVQVSGCEKPVMAEVTRVSSRPEYTNPLMFGPTMRERLSFLTEGRIAMTAACTVPPGTPVGIIIPDSKRDKQ
jgi:HlyD family secretion protein